MGDGGDAAAEGDCMKEVVYSLLSAKATASSQMQVAINSSLIQMAKTNFPFVTAAIFSAVENQKASEQHKLQLLRLLCQILELQRSEAVSSEGVPRVLAKNMTRFLLSEARPGWELLVELAPMHPDLVLGELLANLSGETLPQLEILGEVAAAAPHSLREKLDEVLARCFSLLQNCRAMDQRMLLLRVWCSLCIAMVNCLARHSSNPLDAGIPGFSRQFAAAAAPLRAAKEKGDTTGRKPTQVVSAVFTLLMSAWSTWKDMALRVAAVDALGHFSLVIPKDQFLTNADALLDHIISLLSRQASLTSPSSPMPPLALMRGTCLALQAIVDAERELLTVENTLQTLLGCLFASVVSGGPLQGLQQGLNPEALQSQVELLCCLDVLAETFGRESLAFLLQKAKGNREERLAALLVLRQLAGRPALTSGIVEGVQQLLSDSDPAVGLMLGELLVAMAPALEANARPEHAGNLVGFVIRLTARSQASEASDSGYMPKFVSKGYAHDGPSAEEVRTRAGSVLGQLATLRPLASVLWPLLLKAALNPAMLPGLPALCRTMTQMAQLEKDAEECEQGVGKALATFGQTESLLLWLLICAHSPTEPPGLGLSVLRCLESLAACLHPVLGQIWEAPSKRLQTLCGHLEEALSSSGSLDGNLWVAALAQELHFFLSALPHHDDTAARFTDLLCSLLEKAKKDSRDSPMARPWDVAGGPSELSDAHRAGIFNLTGVCLAHLGNAQKASATLEMLLAAAPDLGRARRAFARGLGIASSRHLDLTLEAIAKAKTETAAKGRGTSLQSLFGKSAQALVAEQLRATLLLSLGFCAINSAGPMLLQEKAFERILKPLHQALAQEKTPEILRSAVDAAKLVGDALRCPKEQRTECDPFLAADLAEVLPEQSPIAVLSEDSPTREALAKHRNELLEALLPLVDPHDQEDDKLALQEMLCPVLDAISSLAALPLALPSPLFTALLERALQVLFLSGPQAKESTEAARVRAVTSVLKALLFQAARRWLGVSKLLQAVHLTGASHAEPRRWTCVQIIGDLCRVAPIVTIPTEDEGESDLGDWSECLALVLPRMGDSSKAVASAGVDAVQQLLARCQYTTHLRLGTTEEYLTLPQDTAALLDDGVAPGLITEREELRGDPAPPSQQLVGALLTRLPEHAMPAMVQYLMPSMHDVDSHAAMTGVDAMHLLLQSCCEQLSAEAASNLVSTIFEEVERVRHSSVRQLVLSCIKVLALHHFDAVIEELLEMGPDFKMSIMGALQVMAKESSLLLKLLNHLTAAWNHPSSAEARQVLSATVAVGHLFTVNDSSIGAAVKKYFSQLFGTFLLRIGTTSEGLHAQQAAGAFMNFLHASQNDSMAMALEGNRLAKVTREFYDEVICELASLFCRHQPRRRETLLQFLQPFLAAKLPGHRVAAMSTMSQLLSCMDSPMERDDLLAILSSVVAAIDDADATVRKQAGRGLGNVAALWQNWEDASQIMADDIVQEVLMQMCRLLSDEAPSVRREAVVAMQRAPLPEKWRDFLLSSSPQHLPSLLDAEDTLLRGASFDLLSRVCQLANEQAGNGDADAVQGVRDREAVEAAFFESLQMMVVQCTIRLEDSSSAVAAAASRCLRHITGTYLFQAKTPSSAEEAWELLQRWEQAQMDFEQFVFPFVALLHVANESELALKRLQLCQRYIKLAPEGCIAPGAPPRTAAGFMGAALLRCLQGENFRPSQVVCSLCKNVLELLTLEEAETRTQAARILGLLDLAT
ncbi:unnamed protein product [Effrenium voratum]|uniref:Uncharacterized protein n=1 Tax=Effrenium voratum TaxID=2562239 RepID=A0AA36JNL2_9DINO|nr:unnamed protein product [Effrenium voratum]